MPGFRPGGRLTFLRAQKGEPKMRPCCLRPFEFRLGEIQEGNLRVLGRVLHRVTLCAPRRSVQTDTVSQSTKQLHSAVQLPAHALRSSAHAKGVGPEYRDSFLVGWALRTLLALMLYPFSRVREKAGMRGLLVSMLLIAAGALQMRAGGSKYLKQIP